MKKLVLLIVVVVALSGCVNSGRILLLESINHIDIDSLDVAELLEENAKHDIVYLDLSVSYEHEASNSQYGIQWKYTVIRDRKYMIINPDKEIFTTFTVNVGKNAVLGNIFCMVTSPEGTSSVFQINDAIVEENSNGSKKYKIIYPNVKKGSIVEEAYEITYPSYLNSIPLKHDIRLQFSNPCKSLSVKYAYPDWWKINVKKLAENDTLDLIYTYDVENHKNIIEYSAQNIPATENEHFSPFFKEIGKYLQMKIIYIAVSNAFRTMPDTWLELAEEYEQYTMRKDGFLTNRVKKTTKKVIKNCETPYEKMEAIVHFVQDSIEIATDKETRNFAKILKDGKGDPFRIAGLAMSMMLKADLDVDYLVIHDARDGYFDRDYIDYDQFTFPALRVRLDDDDHFIFPYLKYLPVDHIPEYFAEQTAMVIPDLLFLDYNKYPEFAEFLETPPGISDDNNITENYQIIIDDDGLMTVREEKILNGAVAYIFREQLVKKEKDEMSEMMEDILTYTDGDVNLKSHEIKNLEDYKKPLSIILEYEIDNLVMVTPEEVIFQTGGLFSPASIKKYKIDTEKRVNPIKIHFDQAYYKNIDILFPENWKMQSKFEDVNIENIFGSIDGTYTIEGNKFIVKQCRILNKSDEPKEKITELLQINGKKSQIYISSIIFDVD